MIMYNAESRQHMDGGAKKLRRIGHFKKIGFQMTAIFLADFTLSDSEFHRVGAANENARVLAFVLTLGIESKPEPYDRSCLGCLAGVSIECKYAGCLVERA